MGNDYGTLQCSSEIAPWRPCTAEYAQSPIPTCTSTTQGEPHLEGDLRGEGRQLAPPTPVAAPEVCACTATPKGRTTSNNKNKNKRSRRLRHPAGKTAASTATAFPPFVAYCASLPHHPAPPARASLSPGWHLVHDSTLCRLVPCARAPRPRDSRSYPDRALRETFGGRGISLQDASFRRVLPEACRLRDLIEDRRRRRSRRRRSPRCRRHDHLCRCRRPMLAESLLPMASTTRMLFPRSRVAGHGQRLHPRASPDPPRTEVVTRATT